MVAPVQSNLFKPLKVGDIELKHRVIMAPLTRFRADIEHVHQDVAVDYYTQRAVVPGTLIITEATFIAEEAGGYNNVPGIWSDAQIKAWKRVTDSVHSKGSFIYLQLWALGRQADPKVLKNEKNGPHPYVSASNIPIQEGGEKPTGLTKEEIKKYVGHYATAAKNAVHGAGFDGVEIHGANGYLIDQFLQDKSNDRTDEYGGSIENRSRFGLEIVKAVVDAVGEKKTGIRLSPFSPFGGMKMDDPIPQFSHFITQIRDNYPSFAYIHVVESRIAGNADVEAVEQTDFALDIWGKDRVFLTAGGYKPASAKEKSDNHDNVAVVLGRFFISNPDLPLRLRYDVDLVPYNRDTFYLYGPDKTEGYVDYPRAKELEGKTI